MTINFYMFGYEIQDWKQCVLVLVYHNTFLFIEFYKASALRGIFLSTQALV